MRFELTRTTRPIVRVVVDLVDDGEPGWGVTLDPTTDPHAFRGFFVKPVRNGEYAFVVTAVDDLGCAGASDGSHRVLVTF